VALRRENVALRTENAVLRAGNATLQAESVVLHERVRELEARLGQTSANSSRPPSSDPPQAPARPKAPSSRRKRGGQPGHRGAHRALLPAEQLDEIVAVVPERCRHCGQPFPETPARGRARVWRHQIVELLPLAVRVMEYQMVVRCCVACGRWTRASLPPDVPRRPCWPSWWLRGGGAPRNHSAIAPLGTAWELTLTGAERLQMIIPA
jgi:Family of unknown function (DUF6444)